MIMITKRHIDHLVQCMIRGPSDWEEIAGFTYHPLFDGLSPDELGRQMVELIRTSAEHLIAKGLDIRVPEFTKEEYRYTPPAYRLNTLEFLRALQGFRMEAEDSPLWGRYGSKNVSWDIVEEYIHHVILTLLDYYTNGEYLNLPLFYNTES